MRLNYYQFPEGVDAHTRWKNGADYITATMLLEGSAPVLGDTYDDEGIRDW